MSWMQKLYQTYEQAKQMNLEGSESLMPISHTLQNAHIEIIIDGAGNFKDAQVLEKTQIVLPATELSAGRARGEAPHPLADKLQYIAADYATYGGKKNAYFESYQQQLQHWINSEHSHPKAEAVYQYISKGTVISDLVAHGICQLDSEGSLLTVWSSDEEQPKLFKVLPKEQGSLDQGNALVCWVVDVEGEKLNKTWKDSELQQKWINHDQSYRKVQALCLVTGEVDLLASNHPAKLRHTGDKAKLISSNDKSGFTYRGRFHKSDEAATISFIATQKTHNALRWLISQKSHRHGDQAIVTWAVSGDQIPPILSEPDEWGEDFYDLCGAAEAISLETQPDDTLDLGASFSQKLKSKLKGYRSNEQLKLTDSICLMVLDSATTGRMAVSYYRDFRPNEYLDNLEKWHRDFAWPQRATDKQKQKGADGWYIGAPAYWRILESAYGDIIKSNKTLEKNLTERLLPIIAENRPFPRDIMLQAVRRASNRQAYKQNEQWLWLQNLSVACSLYRGYHQRHPDAHKRRKYKMALETDNHSRDYLYGRLLAIADNIEGKALADNKTNRCTNAERLMQRFAARPFSTWRNIALNLRPYIQRLRSNSPGFMVNRQNKLDEVYDMINSLDFGQDQPLTGEFLLAFHCQRSSLLKKNDKTHLEEKSEDQPE